MPTTNHIRIPLTAALGMIGRHARDLLREQIHSVAFVVIYLVAFQMLVFGSPPADALGVAVGIALVILGLAFFLEGLRIGLMPLGERVGIQLPARGGLTGIILFGVLLGLGSTFAEPAIAALRTAGRGVAAWEAPILFMLLERMPGLLVASVGAGVGVAVALGLTRFYFGFSLKPLIMVIIPALLAVTIAFSRSPSLSSVVGLAWDTGAVTTGPVTVPLVLALGIGVSRAARKSEGAGSGFGVVMLASALPVLGVMGLSLIVAPLVPAPSSEQAFFAPDRRDETLALFADEDALLRYAFIAGGETGRRAFFSDESEYLAALDELATDPDTRERLIGEMSLTRWLEERASDAERSRLARMDLVESPSREAAVPLEAVFAEEAGAAVRAVVPLTALLGLVLVLLLRDRPRYLDEVLLGIVLALAGMALLTSGIRLGLAPLGDDVGRRLPEFLQEDADEVLAIHGFDPGIVFRAVDATGAERRFFHYYDGDEVHLVEYRPERFDPDLRRYVHQVPGPRLFHTRLPLLGIAIVLVFAFGLGYGSTLAEPALAALGRTVEELTVGTVRRAAVVRAVSIGVGIGLVAGVIRILYDVPITWLLVPPYLLLLPLSAVSEEYFTGIAWDCGGVTTGAVTVPLVLAMGLGIGVTVDMVDGFGILAMASVYPIVTVHIYGLIVRVRQHRTLRAAEEEEGQDG